MGIAMFQGLNESQENPQTHLKPPSNAATLHHRLLVVTSHHRYIGIISTVERLSPIDKMGCGELSEKRAGGGVRSNHAITLPVPRMHDAGVG